MWDEHPGLTVVLPSPVSFDHVTVAGLGTDASLGSAVSRPTRVRVSTDAASVTAAVGAEATRVALPAGPHTRVQVEILDTEEDTPGRVVTGLSEVTIPGVTPTEVVRLPAPATDGGRADAIVLGAGLAGRDGCTSTPREFTCLGGQSADPEQPGTLVRDVPGERPGRWRAGGSLARSGGAMAALLLRSPGVTVATSSVRTDAPQAGPDAVVDGDDRTAWSPAFDDETPEITLAFDRRVTVSTVRLQTRRDWAQRAAPAVVVDIGGREFTRRVQPNGVVEIPPTAGSTLRLAFVRVPGAERAALSNAALELEAVDLAGVSFAAPQDRVDAPCGEGPRLVVDGREVPTRASVTRDELFGLGSGSWTACEPVVFGSGDTHQVEVGTWLGLTAGSAVLRTDSTADAVRASDVARPETLSPLREGPSWHAAVEPSDEVRVLVMDQNANPGWEARLGDAALRPQVVDGRRQAFVVPPGASGELSITYGPDSVHRALLLLGLVLASGLLALCAVALRRPGTVVRSADPGSGRPEPGPSRLPWALGLVAAGVAGVVAGPAGAGAAVAGALLARTPAVRLGLRAPLLVGVGIVACGVTQAVVSPGALGPAVLEGSVRLGLIALVVLAALAPVGQKPRGHS